MQPFPLIDRVETNYAPVWAERAAAQSHDLRGNRFSIYHNAARRE